MNPEHIFSSFRIEMVALTDRPDDSRCLGKSTKETEDEGGSGYRHNGAGGC
jgi:hypothetical protein